MVCTVEYDSRLAVPYFSPYTMGAWDMSKLIDILQAISLICAWIWIIQHDRKHYYAQKLKDMNELVDVDLGPGL